MRSLLISSNLLDAPSSKLRALLRVHIDNQGPAAASYDNFANRLIQLQPEIAVVVLSPAPDAGLEILRRLRHDAGTDPAADAGGNSAALLGDSIGVVGGRAGGTRRITGGTPARDGGDRDMARADQ